MSDPDSSSPLRSLRRVAAPERTPEEEATRQRRIVLRISSLQTELSSRPKARSAMRRFFGEGFGLTRLALYAGPAFAIAVLVLVFFALNGSADSRLQLESGLVFVESSHGRLALNGSQRVELGADDALTTEDDTAQLQLPSHAALSMSPHSAVRLQVPASGQQSNGDQLRLERGVVRLRVPKLAPGQQLTVATGDAVVAVHGTQFSVEVVERAGLAPSTRVNVSEGVVSVTGSGERVVLTAGQSWSSDGAPAPPPAVASQESPVADSAAVAPVPSSVPSANASAASSAAFPPGRTSELAEQNRLFLSARQARNSGNTSLALQQLATLMQRHPGSELAHNARVEHFRILTAAGRLSEARASARRYLRQYPNGFARAEAAKLSAP